MENVITRSKFINETISIVLDFSDLLQPSETIYSVTIIVALFSGTDSDPSNLLYQSPIIAGNVVDQKFRLGLPGVIYEIIFEVTGTLGTHCSKTTNLAILPQEGTAIPSFSVIYETSCLYPYELFDSMQSNVSLSHALMGYVWQESLSSEVLFISGIVGGSLVQYAIPPESLQSELIFISAVLGGNALSYQNPAESMESSIAWLSCTLGGTAISYAIPHEDLQSSIVWFSGSIL